MFQKTDVPFFPINGVGRVRTWCTLKHQSVYFEHKKFKENCNTATKASRMPGSVANFCQKKISL